MLSTAFPVFAPENKTDQYLMIAITLILFVLFWTVILYMYQSTPGALTATTLYEICAPGKCAMNVNTGEKRCLADQTASITYNAGYEICSSATVCDNPKLPFALQSDGSVDLKGRCEDGVTCLCTDKISCPSYVLSTFKMTNGTPYLNSTAAKRYTLNQQPIPDKNTVGWVGPDIDNINTTLCHVSANNLFRIAPNTSVCSNVSSSAPTEVSIHNCLQSNPCLNGTLAVITDTKSSVGFNPSMITQSVFACVPGNPCADSTKWPVFDIAYGRSICV
jgi:hypothetical protein